MGQVFRALDEQLRREVAIKMMLVDAHAPSSEAQARMTREARAAAALSHPNVVAIYDVGAPSADRPSAFPCVPLGVAVAQACASSAVPWCDRTRQPVGCCGQGTTPEGPDGICGCPPGGTLKEEGGGCPVFSGEPYGEKLQPVVRANFPALKECDEQSLNEGIKVSGRLSIGLRIGPGGEVFEATFKESALPSGVTQRCVLSLFRGLRFPPPPGGSFSANYPLTFWDK